MTGFGEGTAAGRRILITALGRSVNHRYLDVSIRLPDILRRYEHDVAKLVRSLVRRGRVELRVDATPLIAENEHPVTLRLEVLRSYSEAIAEARQKGLLASEPAAGDLLRLPEVVAVETAPAVIDDDEKKTLFVAVTDAVEEMCRSRREEGEKLKTVMGEILLSLEGQVVGLARIQGSLSEVLEQRLRARLAALMEEANLDEQRMAMEVAILLERSSVLEELDRLRAHISAFTELLAASDPVGKKLDFLCQEILRELNTVGSKCRESSATSLVLEGKVTCEQLREQVQNIQ
ncbi:MAG: YicC family protein [Acidobacteriota bacterium]|nr:YicC family protein [Acidobacteriota bacterium]